MTIEREQHLRLLTAGAARGMRVVPFVNLSRQHEALWGDLDAAIASVFRRSAFIDGTELREFEDWFAEFCGVRYAVGVASGTDALEFALRALGVKPGDEVVTAANSFIATAAAITATGARPSFVDVSEDTGNVDPARLVDVMTARVKAVRAVVPVHLYGRPAPMAEIGAIARAGGAWVVEDAAQAHGALCGGRRVGSFGDAGCFSFYPTKNLGGAGDGGMVTTNDERVADAVRAWRNHGRTSGNHHVLLGRTGRLDNLQAAVLRVKAEFVEEWNARRREIAGWYRDRLPPAIRGFSDGPDVSVHHLFVVRVPDRVALRVHLQRKGVETAVHYPIALHLQPACRELGYKIGDFPVAERLAREVLSLPMDPFLSRADVNYVCDAIAEFYER